MKYLCICCCCCVTVLLAGCGGGGGGDSADSGSGGTGGSAPVVTLTAVGLSGTLDTTCDVTVGGAADQDGETDRAFSVLLHCDGVELPVVTSGSTFSRTIPVVAHDTEALSATVDVGVAFGP